MCYMTSTAKQRITLFINPSVAKHARAQAIMEGLTLTSFLEKALIDYLPDKTIIKKVKIGTGKNKKK